jgi:hypothetical protein
LKYRSDDTANFQIKGLAKHADLYFMHFALQTKVRRSKAVMVKKCCPGQILLCSYETDFLVGLAIYLEAWTKNGGLQAVKPFSEINIVNKAAINKVKSNCSNNQQNMVFKNVNFKDLMGKALPTNLDIHSLLRSMKLKLLEMGT